MKICFVVRSIYRQVDYYTTTHLAYEAYLRGHEVAYTTTNSFSFGMDDRVCAMAVIPADRNLPSRGAFIRHLQCQDAGYREVCLSEYNVVFLRHNPNEQQEEQERIWTPAIEFGRLLRNHGVHVINDPGGLVRAASKMYLSSFPPDVRIPTLVSKNAPRIKEFIKRLQKPAIIKPLRSFGGQDVFYVKSGKDININQIIASASKNGYVVVQEYLPKVREGDKRLLLLNGSPIFVGNRAAIFSRISPKGEIRSNIRIGGTRKAVEFGVAEERIVEAIRPRLVEDGLYFVGADIVGDRLMEINVFCPGGIHNINELYNINVGEHVICDLEKRSRNQTHRPSKTRPRLVEKTV